MKCRLNKRNLKHLQEEVDYMNDEFKYEGSSDRAFVLIDEKERTCTIAVLRSINERKIDLC